MNARIAIRLQSNNKSLIYLMLKHTPYMEWNVFMTPYTVHQKHSCLEIPKPDEWDESELTKCSVFPKNDERLFAIL